MYSKKIRKHFGEKNKLDYILFCFALIYLSYIIDCSLYDFMPLCSYGAVFSGAERVLCFIKL